MKIAKELESRGFVHQLVGESLEDVLDGEPRVIYHGIDPTADSAHAGNFVIWVLLRHLANAGHKIIFLVGGGTGLIGDPKPDGERELRDESEVVGSVAKIQQQAEAFFAHTPEPIEFVNNSEWLGELKLVDFLRNIGKCFTVNELIKKEAIARRLEGDTGLSYTEFAYPLLQGFDYLQLYRTKNCTVQVGGSDQWGNMVAGVDLIRRQEQAETYAITIPLIVDKATNKKFGKSEGNAIWLDAEKTSPYQFYQFWLNTSDESVIDFLKLFTFLSLDDIATIERDTQTNPSARVAQRILAKEVTTAVHNETQALAAEQVSDTLFGDGELADLNQEQRNTLLENAPTHSLEADTPVVDVLVDSGLATSKREARTFIESGAVTINREKIEDAEMNITASLFTNELAILRRGKKQMMVLQQK